MKTVKLPEICTIPITDGTHQTPTYATEQDGIPFISSKDVTSKKIDWKNIKYITKELHEQLYKRIAPQKDDLLLAKNGTTGVAALVEDDKIFDIYVTLAVIRPDLEKVFPKYLFHVINSPFCKNQFNSHLVGIGVPNLHLKDINQTEIPLPTLPEQQKIATELDTIQSAIDNKKQQLSLLDEAVKSKFVEMFGKSNCQQVPFSEYAEIIDGDRGKNYPKSEDFSEDGYCLFLSAKNVTKEGFSFYTNQFISKEKDMQLRKGKLNRGDIVITTRGTIGNIAYYDESIPYENVRINSGMVIIRSKELEYNQLFFLQAFRNKIDEIIKTQVTGAAQPQLPIHIMSKITLPYPPLDLQKQFAAFVQKTDNAKSLVKQQLADLQELLDSKMQEYFA